MKDITQGLDTNVGDEGISLSGGERQRIGIARELFRKPKLLILDEATSALDKMSEALVRTTLKKFYGSITIILVTHNIENARIADLSYLMEDWHSPRSAANLNLLLKSDFKNDAHGGRENKHV